MMVIEIKMARNSATDKQQQKQEKNKDINENKVSDQSVYSQVYKMLHCACKGFKQWAIENSF